MTRVRVVVLRGAEGDLQELRRYLRQRFGEAAWDQCLTGLRKTLAQIAAHPQAGHLPDELVPLHFVQYRQLLSGNNRIIYELRGDVAYVHVVCDTRRDLRALLLRRLLEAPGR